MARAKKCDICGGLYERPYDARRRIEIVKDCHPYPDNYKYDLCDKCYKKLLTFLNEQDND